MVLHRHHGSAERVIPRQQVPQARWQRQHSLAHGYRGKHAIDHRVQPGEDHGLELLESGKRRGNRPIDLGDHVADLGVGDVFDVRDHDPGFAEVEALNRRLGAIGNLKSDGRPILGLDSRDLLEICLEVCPEVLFIPAHIWTPHFAALGSASGFDSVEECYEDLLPHIPAVETGLSSDPPMNSRIAELDRFALVSNSDAHSPQKLAREGTCFDTDISYPAMLAALRSRDPARFTGTLEFYPEEGKYHCDGHRNCQVRWKPSQTLAAGGHCPVCGQQVTVGVLHRVELLADRPEGEGPNRPCEYLIPLTEVIGSALGVGPSSKKVQAVYQQLLASLGPELDLLRHVPPEQIAATGEELVAEGVRRMREGQVQIAAGYDGEYGVIQLFTDEERQRLKGQKLFFSLPAEPAPLPSTQERVEPRRRTEAEQLSLF